MPKIGRPATFHAALARMRQRQKIRAQFPVAHAVLNSVDKGVILPQNPRTAASSQFTSLAVTRGMSRVEKAIRRAQERAAEAAQEAESNAAYVASFADPRADEAETADPRSTRPPRPEAGRYDGLKGGEPG